MSDFDITGDEARQFLLDNKILTSEELYPEAIAITRIVLRVVVKKSTEIVAKEVVKQLRLERLVNE